jgi:hypothetical protein
MFLKVQKNLSVGTVEKHIALTNVFLEHSKGAIDAKSVQNFMLWVKNNKSQKTYRMLIPKALPKNKLANYII